MSVILLGLHLTLQGAETRRFRSWLTVQEVYSLGDDVVHNENRRGRDAGGRPRMLRRGRPYSAVAVLREPWRRQCWRRSLWASSPTSREGSWTAGLWCRFDGCAREKARASSAKALAGRAVDYLLGVLVWTARCRCDVVRHCLLVINGCAREERAIVSAQWR
jgi:hypothetical protein